jgi:hypothetical protein
MCAICCEKHQRLTTGKVMKASKTYNISLRTKLFVSLACRFALFQLVCKKASAGRPVLDGDQRRVNQALGVFQPVKCFRVTRAGVLHDSKACYIVEVGSIVVTSTNIIEFICVCRQESICAGAISARVDSKACYIVEVGSIVVTSTNVIKFICVCRQESICAGAFRAWVDRLFAKDRQLGQLELQGLQLVKRCAQNRGEEEDVGVRAGNVQMVEATADSEMGEVQVAGTKPQHERLQ